MKLLNKIKTFILVSLPNFAFASSISKGLPGLADKIQTVSDTMCGPIAFIVSVAGLVGAAVAWKFAGHSQGMKIAAAAIAGMLILANVVGWVGYFAGAII